MAALPMISLENAAVRLGGRTVLGPLEWQWQQGQHWLLFGDNGAGKSTFLKLLAGVLSANGGGRRIYHLGGETFEAAAGLGNRIVLLSPEKQVRHARLAAGLSVWEVILSGFENTDYVFIPPSAAQKRRAKEIARSLELTGLLRRKTDVLSQGQLRRALLARALVNRPVLLLLDEYGHGLDAHARKCMAQALRLAVKLGTHVISATHHRDESGSWATHWLRLENGRMTDCKEGIPSGAWAADDGDLLRKRIFKKPKANPRVLVRIAHADVVAVEGSRTIPLLYDIDWTLHAGEHTLITGSNGAGKSTLLKLLYGDLTCGRGGSVQRFLGAKDALFLPEARLRMGLLSAELHQRFDPSQTLVQAVASGFTASLGLWRSKAPAQHAAARRILRDWGMESLANRPLSEVSFGQARLALLARACVRRPPLLILDEPFDGLSAQARADLRVRLEWLAQKGTTLVITTHHPGEVPALPMRRLEVRSGRLHVLDE